ncbi:MAG: hypothetical protein ABJH07_03670 [Sedimentitalea sp.]
MTGIEMCRIVLLSAAILLGLTLEGPAAAPMIADDTALEYVADR